MTQAQSWTTEDAIAAYRQRKRRESALRWYYENKKRALEYSKAYYQAHREELIEYAKEYRRTHKKQVAQYNQTYCSKRAQKKEAEENEGLYGGGAGRDGGV